jgi:hypothetical protein
MHFTFAWQKNAKQAEAGSEPYIEIDDHKQYLIILNKEEDEWRTITSRFAFYLESFAISDPQLCSCSASFSKSESRQLQLLERPWHGHSISFFFTKNLQH